jgi:hypothetical protein
MEKFFRYIDRPAFRFCLFGLSGRGEDLSKSVVFPVFFAEGRFFPQYT